VYENAEIDRHTSAVTPGAVLRHMRKSPG